MNSIFHRTSVRKYVEDKPVEAEKVEKLLRAAMAAPSAKNQQPWEFYVVTNKEMLEKLSTVSPFALCVAKAPLAIVPCMRKAVAAPASTIMDVAAATENILLEADALGLGACWLGVAPGEDRMLRAREFLNIPASLDAFAVIAIGYPAREKEQVDRFDAARIHFVK